MGNKFETLEYFGFKKYRPKRGECLAFQVHTHHMVKELVDRFPNLFVIDEMGKCKDLAFGYI